MTAILKMPAERETERILNLLSQRRPSKDWGKKEEEEEEKGGGSEEEEEERLRIGGGRKEDYSRGELSPTPSGCNRTMKYQIQNIQDDFLSCDQHPTVTTLTRNMRKNVSQKKEKRQFIRTRKMNRETNPTYKRFTES